MERQWNVNGTSMGNVNGERQWESSMGHPSNVNGTSITLQPGGKMEVDWMEVDWTYIDASTLSRQKNHLA
jgi:hypothetical protein